MALGFKMNGRIRPKPTFSLSTTFYGNFYYAGEAWGSGGTARALSIVCEDGEFTLDSDSTTCATVTDSWCYSFYITSNITNVTNNSFTGDSDIKDWELTVKVAARSFFKGEGGFSSGAWTEQDIIIKCSNGSISYSPTSFSLASWQSPAYGAYRWTQTGIEVKLVEVVYFIC